MTPLSSARRSELRSQAHRLKPVVIIGDKGLTGEVLAEIDRSLKAHELIKVRAVTDERDARDVWLDTICTTLEAHPIQQIGKVFVLYRENPEEKLGPGPPASGMPGQARRGDKQEREATGTSRRRSRTPSPRPASEPRRRRPRTSR